MRTVSIAVFIGRTNLLLTKKGEHNLKYLTAFQHNRQRRGFTLAETLIVVGILVILMALLIPNIVQIQRDLRQKELDAKAEILYVAAQNELAKLRASGNGSVYGANLAAHNPFEWKEIEVTDESGETTTETVYLLSNGVTGIHLTSKNWMSGKADADLLGNRWVIVFDPDTAAVKEVFYCATDDINHDREDADTSTEESFLTWRPGSSNDRSDWKRSEIGRVGYYGGDGPDIKAKKTVHLKPEINVGNGEILYLTVDCDAPTALGSLSFTLTVFEKDHSGFRSEKTYDTSSLPSEARYEGGRLTVVLDALSQMGGKEVEFGTLFPHVTPGVPLSVTVEVEPNSIPDDYTVISEPDTWERFNAYFDDTTGAPETIDGENVLPAKISCGRHLQNLHVVTGGNLMDPYGDGYVGVSDPDSAIAYDRIKAVQTKNISFRGDSEWVNVYGSRKFEPIENGILASYSGQDDGGVTYVISGLNAEYSGGDRGLLARVPTGASTTLQHVRLTGEKVAGANAGGLVGVVSGECTITDCGVYLDYDLDVRGQTYSDKLDRITTNMISGTNVGGLVGFSNGELSIKKSYAATTMRGTSRAGGLVGMTNVEGGKKVMIETSYADSYVTGHNIGGLAGNSVTSVSDCYAAGYLIPNNQQSVSAGLVNGKVTELERSYTVCDLGKGNKTYATVCSCTNLDTVYFRYNGTLDSIGITFTKKLSPDALKQTKTVTSDDGEEKEVTIGWFQSGGGTTPYNLRNQKLTYYPFPHLKDVPAHYGDWRKDFQSGEFVYFEKYDNGTPEGAYAFTSGDEYALDEGSASVLGDGYGVALEWPAVAEVTITVMNPATGDEKVYSTKEQEGVTKLKMIEKAPCGKSWFNIYYLPVLPTDCLSTDFYMVAKVEVGSETANYYFNPVFADTVLPIEEQTGEGEPAPLKSPNAPDPILVHSARQLYYMAWYYDTYYSDVTSNKTFRQQRNIDFRQYQWKTFADFDVTPKSQPAPIGFNGFKANYDGDYHTVSNVGVSANYKNDDTLYHGTNLGLFGRLTFGHSISNLFFVSDYAPEKGSDYTINENKTIEPKTGSVTYAIGGLVGRNEGTITNCAVAGLRLTNKDGDTIYTYTNSTLYAGGLVGYNSASGVITNCSAVVPEIKVDALFSNVYVGGFVGGNYNDIRFSYAIAALGGTARTDTTVSSSTNVTVYLSGFAGTNPGGQISNSYCATSMDSAGAVTSYGFAPMNGSAKDCEYLDKGTYSFVGALHNYDAGDAALKAGRAVTYGDMTGKAFIARAATSPSHAQSEETVYPFRCYVKNAAGYVHYGDWPLAPMLGEMGVFYWEKEEGGSNPGYHFSALGLWHDGDNVKYTSAGTLCTAHDDGGTITDYGYGYYFEEERFAGKVRLKNEKDNNGGIVANSTWMTEGQEAPDPNSKVQNAQDALQRQVPGYTFLPYLTQYSDSPTTEDCLFLTQGDNNVATKPVVYGTWKLLYKETGWAEGEEEDESTCDGVYPYKVTPFFADAMTGPAQPDGSKKTRTEDPGTANNQFDIRSVQQLRYINWNTETHDCDTLVYGEENQKDVGNYRRFPFLQYATVLKIGVQKRTDVEDLRPPQSWKQSHDLQGTEDLEMTPIAGMATSSPVSTGNYQNILFTWFGGSYDGQSYKIKNLNVCSPAYTVGLFGATAGATIENIIMYSDNVSYQAYVKRDTAGKTVTVAGKTINFESKTGAYCIGGLVGIAYEYKTNNITNSINNCSIAGYQVIDRSTNQQGAGTANVGGLVGLANMNLRNCSSTADVVLDCTHAYGHMAWGSYFRIGALAGSAGAPGATVTVDDCYTGGSITVTERTMYEKPLKNGIQNNRFIVRDGSNTGYTANLFVSGMIGGSYAPNISNFSNQNSNSPDGIARINNCYTYTSLPSVDGTVRAVSLFANQADRYWRASKIYLTNCWYLGTIKDNVNYPQRDDPRTWPVYYDPDTDTYKPYIMKIAGDTTGIKNAPTNEEWTLMRSDPETLSEEDRTKRQTYITKYQNLIPTEDDYQQMLQGNLTFLKTYYFDQNNNAVKSVLGEAKAVSYSELIGRVDVTVGEVTKPFMDWLNNDSDTWQPVTTTDDSGSNVSGKYSFSSAPSQTGMDYPFPAVVRQVDGDDDPDNDPLVHYGAWPWPTSGVHWAKGRDSMDIFSILENGNSSYTETEPSSFSLTLTGDDPISTDTITVKDSDGNVISGAETEADKIHIESVTDPASDGKSTVATLKNVLPGGPITVTADTAEGNSVQTVVRRAPAEKTFQLKLDEMLTDDPNISPWTLLTFSVDPLDKAQVVNVQWAKKTVDGTEVPDLSTVDVTLRALGVDTVKLTAALNKEPTKTASCFVTITAHLEVEVRPVDQPDADPISEIDLLKAGDKADCICTAGAFTDQGEWRYVNGKEGTIILTPNDETPNSFKVEYGSAGDSSVTINYTYYYYGAGLTAGKVVDVRTMGYVGLSDGNRAVIRERRSDAKPQGPDGVDVPGIRPQGADLILYVPAAEGDLGDFNITWTAPEGTKITSLTTEQGYTLLETSNGYQYRGFTLRSLGSADVPNCTVSFTLKKGTTEDYTLTLEGLTAYRYQVRFDKNAAHARTVENLQAIGVTAGTILPANEEQELISRIGYKFNGWSTMPDGSAEGAICFNAENEWTVSAEAYSAFESLAHNSTVTLYAQWTPITYSVVFDPNPPVVGTTEIEPVTIENIEYSDDETHPPLMWNFLKTGEGDLTGVFLPEEEGAENKPINELVREWQFLNWNELFYGGGATYEAGQPYTQPTEDGATLYLFAQWKIATHELTLAWGEDGIKTYTIRNGAAQIDLTDTPVTLGTNNWPVDSWWYAAPSGQAIQILEIETDPETGKRMGSIVSGAEAASFISQDPETGDLFFDLSDDSVVLVPSCSAVLYVQIGAMGAATDPVDVRQSYNGDYLIVSGNTAGTQNALALTGKDENKGQTSSVPVTVLSGTGSEGRAIQYIIAPPADNAVWTANYETKFSDNDYCCYSFANKAGGTNKYLRQNAYESNNTFAPLVRGSDGQTNDRLNWTCTVAENGAVTLRSNYDIKGSGGGKNFTALFNETEGSATYGRWICASGGTCYLFRLQSVTILNPLNATTS